MNKKTRKLLLYSLVLGFMVTAGAFLFYALGWSLNRTAEGVFTFQKTGAIFLKTKPSDALIKINGKTYIQNHGLFDNGGELIKGLLPGNYQIEVSKENFGSWQKKLLVKAGLIFGASKIFQKQK